MRKWAAAWPLGIGILIGLLVAGALFLISRPPRGQSIRLSPPPEAPPLAVYVSGAVAHPGMYELPQGSRVQDAIQAAGGALPQAMLESLNLAAPLEDGAQVYVLSENETGPPGATTGGFPSRSGEVAAGSLVNINTATQEELEGLPGIGPTRARAIIAYREEHGPFPDIEAIQEVEGIGEGIFEEIKGLITVR
jgi:competence protein ComEA